MAMLGTSHATEEEVVQDITGSFQQLSGCLLLPGKLKRRQALGYRTNHRHAGGAILLFGHFHKEKPQDHYQNFLHLRYVLEEFPVTGALFSFGDGLDSLANHHQ